MTLSPYEWSLNGRHPIIRQHSIAKHEILREYLVDYFRTLISAKRQEVFKLTLVDGFAGGGIYRHADDGREVLGSPFVMLDAVQEASTLVNQNRIEPVKINVDYFFIEKKESAFEVLQSQFILRGYQKSIDSEIYLRKGKFEQYAASIIKHIRDKSPRAARGIFLLDQYGYSQVPASLIRKIFQELPGAEVILTFAVDSFLNFVNDDGVASRALKRVGITDLLRGRSIEALKASDKDWRLFIQSSMHKELVDACGAWFYTTFFIRSSHGHGDYWLIHLSQKPRARDVMTRIHWKKNNYFIHYGGPGLDMFSILGYVSEKDSGYTGQGALSYGYQFDEPAHHSSVSMLMHQVPRLIYPDDAGMTFGELFASTCNLTPSSGEIYKEAIAKLIEEKELEAISQDGKIRRSALQIHDSDQIIPPRQRKFIF